jgi:hypothetical protein
MATTRGPYRRRDSEAPAQPRRVHPELGAFELSPAQVFVTLAALCDPVLPGGSHEAEAGGMAAHDRWALGTSVAEQILGRR